MWVPKKIKIKLYTCFYYKKKELRYNYNKIKTKYHNLENAGSNIGDMIFWPSKSKQIHFFKSVTCRKLVCLEILGHSMVLACPICYWSLFFTSIECSVLSHCHFWEEAECQVSVTFHNYLKRDVVMYIFTHSTQKAGACEFL